MARGYKARTAYKRRSLASARAGRRRALVSRNRAKYRRASSRRNRAFRLYRSPFSNVSQGAILKYHQTITLDPTVYTLGATGSNVYQFSANSLYDPDVTGTGHQPMFFDNYMLLYKKWRVDSSRISVTVVNHSVNTATANSSGTVTSQPNYSYKLFILREGTSGATNEYPLQIDSFIEEANSNARWRYVAPQLNGRLPTLKHSCIPHKLMCLSPKDDSLIGTSGAGPTNNCYYYIGITSADQVTNPPSVTLAVTITYFCRFFDRETVQNQN